MACLTALVVLASCAPQAIPPSIPAQTSAPISTNTPEPTDVSPGGMDGLRAIISEIIATKRATVGIGIYDFEKQDTLFIHGDEQFVMLSVVKFPQAIAILNQVDEGILNYDSKIHFDKSDLLPNTYSPLRDERAEGNFDISLSEALSYTISKSDNNVCDKLFKVLGGTNVAEEYIHSLGFNNISIGTDYANMEKNTIYANQSSPKDMLELLRMFYENELLSQKSSDLLWEKMVETSTGPDRIKGLLPEGTVVGHKTGTSGTDENGITAAFNDIGIVKLPNGGSFAMGSFISDAKEDNDTNARILADISKAAYDYLDK